MPVNLDEKWEIEREEGKPSFIVNHTVKSRWNAADIIAIIQEWEGKTKQAESFKGLVKQWDGPRKEAREILGMDSSPEVNQEAPKPFPEQSTPMDPKGPKDKETEELKKVSDDNRPK